ncbi:MAG: SurA N-terminal domain-containing protein [Pseudomonadales bacterium]
MLQSIRDNAQSSIAKGIVALMIVPFVFFGIDSFFTGGGAKNVAEVNGVEISERDLIIGIENQKRRIQGQMGDSFDPTIVTDAMLKPGVLESLIQRQLYSDSAESLGLEASEDLLDQTIVSSPEFQENGQFSTQRYEGLLRANGMLPSDHRQQLRTQITARHLLSGFAETDFVTKSDLANTTKVTHQRRDIRYIVVPAANAADVSAIADEEVKTYYEANTSEFMREDQLKLDYLELKLSDFKADVSEEEIRDTYDREKAAFEPDVDWQVAHILAAITDDTERDQASAKINEVKTRLNAGEEFSVLAESSSDDTGSSESGGELGYFGPGVFPEFDSALKDLEVGQVSEVVETESGLHLLKLLDVKKSKFATYDESRERIELELQGSRATPEYISKIEELEDATFGADDLTLAGEELGLAVQSTSFFGRSNGAGIAEFSTLRAYAFSDEFLAQAQNSEKIELGEERVVVVRLNEYREAEPKPLIEVAEQIRAQLQSTRIAKASTDKANTALEKVKASESVENAAKALGLEWQVQLQAERNTLTVDRAIVDAAFSEEGFVDGRALVVANLANGDRAVVEVSNVQAGSLQDMSVTDRTALSQGLSEMLGGRSFDDYFKSVRAKATVTTL